MSLRALIAVLVLGVFGGQAHTADLIGYAEAFNYLYSVDLTARTAAQIGGAGLIYGQPSGNIEGLTFSPAGVLYAVNDAGATKTLLTIEKTTGLATPIGVLNLSGPNTSGQIDLGLAFTCDGRLWMSSRYGDLWQIDPTNASVTAVGNTGVTVTGLATKGNALFGTGSQGDNQLYAIDPATAKASSIGGYGLSNYVTTASPGVDSSGHLWAILAYVPPKPGTTEIPPWSDLASIDPRTGTLTKLGNIVGPPELQTNFYGDLKGLAIVPTSQACGVVTPGVASTPMLPWPALLALGAALALIGGTRARRGHL